MSDTEPNDPRPAPESQSTPSAGPAGWPGATHFGQQAEEPAPVPKRPEEVEAVPLSRSQARGPAIEVEAERIVNEPAAAQKPADPPRTESGPPPPPPPVPPAGSQATAAPFIGSRVWAVLAHLAYLIPFNVPGLIVTLLIWICTRRANPFADDQAREALNFQLNYAVVSTLLAVSCFLSWLYFPFWMVGAILSIVAAVNAGDGTKYRYPYIFRLIK